MWRWLTTNANLTMAIAAKHLAGTRATWLGLTHLSELGATVIGLDKHVWTLSALEELVGGQRPPVREYESLLGMLEHLLAWASGDDLGRWHCCAIGRCAVLRTPWSTFV